ncbi:hypothetical protein [Saccharothrix sp. HUAS TT1]|uniref:hypothetical protein n=1 Tax=unclassified Saccharothrix TaxID=2593673 RepID=UPI00345C4EC5
MSGNRTRGLLRAAALLAVGSSPLLASAASAAEAPTDIVDGKFGNAPEVGADATKPVTDLLSGQAVKLPAPLPGVAQELRAPQVAAPAALQAPTVPGAPQLDGLLAPLGAAQLGAPLGVAPQARALPETPALPLAPVVSGPAQAPGLSDLGQLPLPAPLG